MRALAPAFRSRAPCAPLPCRRPPCPTVFQRPPARHARAWPSALPRPASFRSAPYRVAAPCAPDRLTALTRQSQQQVTP